MRFKAEDLRVGDVVSKPDGFMDWRKWEHTIVRISEERVFTRFCNGEKDSIQRHVNSVLMGTDWMSLANMQTCLDQEDTVVHRDGKQIYPVLETAHTDADMSANSNREEG